MKVTRAGRQPCDPKYSRLAERIEALQAEIAALASELSVVSGSAGQAVVTAEDAQASAAASAAEAGTARTAAEAAADVAQGVSDRVTAAEAAIDDVQDYAEAIGDDVSALDTEIHTSRPYVDTNTEQSITAKKHIPTATANDSSDVWVNKAFVQATDGRNNLVHNIGDEIIDGSKTYVKIQKMVNRSVFNQRVSSNAGWYKVFSLTVANRATLRMSVTESHQSFNGGGAGEVIFGLYQNPHCDWLTSKFYVSAWDKGNVACVYNSETSRWEIWYRSTGFFAYLDITSIFIGNIENNLAIQNVYDGIAHTEIPSEYTTIKYGE